MARVETGMIKAESGRVRAVRLELLGERGTRITVYVWRDAWRHPVDVHCDLGGLWLGLANRLPRRLVFFAGVRLLASSTTGQHDGTPVEDVTVVRALQDWQRESMEWGH
jgi:hypothetical protein